MTTTSVKQTICPTCHKALDMATAISGKATPKMGDLTICFYCGQILVFDKNIRIRPISDDLLAVHCQNQPEGMNGMLRVREAIRGRTPEETSSMSKKDMEYILAPDMDE